VCQRRQHYVQPLSTFVEVGGDSVVCSGVDTGFHTIVSCEPCGQTTDGSCAVPAVAPIVVCVR